MSNAPPRVPDDARVLDGLRELLLDQAEEMKDALGHRPRINPLMDIHLLERRLADDRSQAATLAKLFLLCEPVAVADAAEALAPVEIETLAEVGLVAHEEDVARPLAAVTRYDGMLVVSDPLRDPDRLDFVTGTSPSARRVDRLTIRRTAARALDLGTGAGTQALRAAGHCDVVVAVDISERALAFARFNAALNGLTNIELRAGDWFESVAGERFDLIVANPPYVVSPDSALLYRDSDLPGDAVTRKLVREAPGYLEEGGFAHVMGNWIHGRDGDWRGPVEECLAGSGCDALLLKYATLDPVQYAAQWNLLAVAAGAEPFLDNVDRWLDYYRREGIEALSEVMVVLRRRPGGRNWVRAIEIPGSPTGPAGDHVLRLFEARDRREELNDDETRFALAPGVKMTRRAKGPKLTEEDTKIELENGIGFAVSVQADLVERLASLDPATARRLFALGLIVIESR